MKINEKNLCMFATTPPVDLEGCLNKRGEVNKSWQRRWFVLKGNLLFYFERKGEREPLGMIILEGCTVELAEEGEQYCFQIIFHGPNNRTYYLSTESQDNMEQWMKALTCAGYDYMKLMVAELQRQLDEIEGGCKLPTPENTPLTPPKAPPRRQNPGFQQRPAAPPIEYASNAAPPSNRRCRLCLTAFDDASNQAHLLDIFRDKGRHFARTIRDCTGVFILPDDAVTTICHGCDQTVHFIDEFRSLCRRSDKDYESAVGRAFEGGPWGSYRYHVGELRRLLPGEPGEDSDPMDEEPVDVQFEWADAEDMLDIKQEAVDGDNDEDDYEEEEEEEDDAEQRQVDRLAFAKAIYEQKVLWDPKFQGTRTIHLREQAWNKLAATFKQDKAALKKQLNRLNDFYRKKRWSSVDSDDELYRLLNSIYGIKPLKPYRLGIAQEARAALAEIATDKTADERLKLAQILYDNEALWNKAHPEHDNPSKWTKVASQLNMTKDQLKRHYKSFKDVYYSRRRRVVMGQIKSDHPILHDPLFVLIGKMVEGNSRPRERQKPKPSPSTIDKEYPPTSPERMRLVELLYANETIWNRFHRDYCDMAKRDEAFNRVADQANMSVKELKHQWRTLRGFFNNRYVRMVDGSLGPDHPLLNEPIYLLLKKMFHDNRVQAEGDESGL